MEVGKRGETETSVILSTIKIKKNVKINKRISRAPQDKKAFKVKLTMDQNIYCYRKYIINTIEKKLLHYLFPSNSSMKFN